MITPREVVVGFYLTLERSGVPYEAAAAKATKAARSIGLRFDEASVGAWLSEHSVQTPMFESAAPDPDPPKGAKSKDVPPWVRVVERAAFALAARHIGSFSPEDRIAAGRFHVLRFANCRKSEATNLARGMRCATAFAQMATSPRYSSMTFAVYVDLAKRVHEANGRAPWFDPWRIRIFEDATDARGIVKGMDAAEVLARQGDR